MAIRTRQKNVITVADVRHVTQVAKLSSASVSSSSPILRWIDTDNVWQEIQLFSDQYPNLPSGIIRSPGQTPPQPRSYWFNYLPTEMHPLLREVLSHLQIHLKEKIPSARNRVTQRIKHLAVFFSWLIDNQHGPFFVNASKHPILHPEFPTTVRDINVSILANYRNYLYEKHDVERLDQGKDKPPASGLV